MPHFLAVDPWFFFFSFKKHRIFHFHDLFPFFLGKPNRWSRWSLMIPWSLPWDSCGFFRSFTQLAPNGTLAQARPDEVQLYTEALLTLLNPFATWALPPERVSSWCGQPSHVQYRAPRAATPRYSCRRTTNPSRKRTQMQSPLEDGSGGGTAVGIMVPITMCRRHPPAPHPPAPALTLAVVMIPPYLDHLDSTLKSPLKAHFQVARLRRSSSSISVPPL